MNWDYLGGYSDGESCILLGIFQEKRVEKRSSMRVDGWNMMPHWMITSYDMGVLNNIIDFLAQEGISVSKLYREKNKRRGQTQNALRITVGGWDNVENFFISLIPHSIAKRKQFELFLDLKQLVRPDHRRRSLWNKKKFLLAMEIVDNINSLKSRKRGKYNKKFFEELWEDDISENNNVDYYCEKCKRFHFPFSRIFKEHYELYYMGK